jgi:hypothetical protein
LNGQKIKTGKLVIPSFYVAILLNECIMIVKLIKQRNKNKMILSKINKLKKIAETANTKLVASEVELAMASEIKICENFDNAAYDAALVAVNNAVAAVDAANADVSLELMVCF